MLLLTRVAWRKLTRVRGLRARAKVLTLLLVCVILDLLEWLDPSITE